MEFQFHMEYMEYFFSSANIIALMVDIFQIKSFGSPAITKFGRISKGPP